MKRRLIGKNSRVFHRVWLYSVVYTTRFSACAVFVLFCSFMVQPFHQAFANESLEAEVVNDVLPEEVEEQLPDPVDESAEDNADAEITDEPVESESDENIDLTETESEIDTDDADVVNEGAEDEESPENSEIEESESQDLNTDDTQETVDDTATSTDATQEQGDGSSDTNATSTESVDVETETSTSSDQTATSTEQVNDTSTTTQSTTGGGEGSNDDQNQDDSTAATSTENTSNTGGDASSSDSNNEDESDDSDNQDTSNSSDDEDVDSDSNTPTDDEEDDLIDDQAIEDGVNDLVDGVVNEVVNLTRQLVTEENYYQFSRQSCVAVGDGAYHCSTQSDVEIDPDSAVYAEQDAQGDMEIYMRTSKGDIKQLTDNNYDDTSPDVDLASMRVVWQRLIDGRYQVISYDLNEQEETQLTFSRNNSMEPKVSLEGVVWQAWDGNDWEIMHFDGQFTDQITTNSIQDVTPVIEDGYILWSVLGGEEAEARVFEIETGEIMTISGTDGGTVANPRFVLVYDTKFDNGDVITQGFDPVTGLAQPISAQPVELPFDIPTPDPVGEIRALIQNKSTTDDTEVIVVPTGETDGDLNLASTTATSTDTLNLDQLDQDLETGSSTEATDIEIDEFDLVITDTASSTEAAINTDPLEVNLPIEIPTTTIATSTQE